VEEVGERGVRPELDVPVGAVRKVVVTEVGSAPRLRRCQFFRESVIMHRSKRERRRTRT
jgi:hypothetical protein